MGEHTILITEETLLVLAENKSKYPSKERAALTTDKFSLLVNPHFKALLTGKVDPNQNQYQAEIIFDNESIYRYFQRLIQQKQYSQETIKYLQNILDRQSIQDYSYFGEFAIAAIDLLTTNETNNPSPNFGETPPMEKLVHERVEQQHILDSIKIKISQNLNLWEIIQSAIEQACQFLKLDRLLIYQLDVSLQSLKLDFTLDKTLDIITYEAKKNSDIQSVLYFQDETCFRQSSRCKNKYRQGFSLAINDVDLYFNFTPCLRSLMQKFGVKAKVVTPIVVQGKLWGLTIAHQCFTSREWQSREIQFLRQISEYLAIAIYQNQSYQQLQQQKRFLEKQVKAQAQQIKNALIAAEAASQSKHEFIGSMSHELRTPLTCVIGLSGTLLQWSMGQNSIPLPIEKQQQYLKLIQDSGKHLLNLINNILEFSEVESGKHLLNISRISLNRLIGHTLQIIQEQAKSKQINLNLEFKVEQQYVFFADRERLQEILLNLLSNGIKFTPPGGEVTLRIWRENHQLIFQIEDTGIGIAETEIPLLFEKFKQLEDYRRRTNSGTGFGLALTKQLVELHGGNIEVESELGAGSIFTVYIPEKNVSQDKSEPGKHLLDRHNLKSLKVMLVTNDEENATFICQLLTAVGYQVFWLTDSATALDRIELLEPNAIVIDRDCLVEEIKNIRQEIVRRQKSARLSLILLCFQLTEPEWQDFAARGVDDYLLKSMNPTQIIDKINASIHQKLEPQQSWMEHS